MMLLEGRHTHTCMHTHMHTHTHIYTYIYTYTHTCTYTCTCTHTQEVVDAGLAPSCVDCVDVMLPLLVSVLDPPTYSSGDELVGRTLTRVLKALSILTGTKREVESSFCLRRVALAMLPCTRVHNLFFLYGQFCGQWRSLLTNSQSTWVLTCWVPSSRIS